MRYEMRTNEQQEKIETDIYKECKKAASTIHDAMARLSGEQTEIIMVSEMAEYLYLHLNKYLSSFLFLLSLFSPFIYVFL
jgi:hypothetical protein